MQGVRKNFTSLPCGPLGTLRSAVSGTFTVNHLPGSCGGDSLRLSSDEPADLQIGRTPLLEAQHSTKREKRGKTSSISECLPIESSARGKGVCMCSAAPRQVTGQPQHGARRDVEWVTRHTSQDTSGNNTITTRSG